jgi:tellurite resistance protein TehA-like permease
MKALPLPHLTSAAAVGSALELARRNVVPGWFATVMGTGILGIGLRATAPDAALARVVAESLFVLASVLFVGLVALLAWRLVSIRTAFRASLEHRATAQGWGAPPMAALTLSVGSLTIAPSMAPPETWCFWAQLLFVAGSVSGTLVAIVVTYRGIVGARDTSLEMLDGAWLLPVVPPVVASVPAALLATSWPLELRSSILAAAYAMLGLGDALAAITIGLIVARLLRRGLPAAAAIPSLWIVVGPLGQSAAGAVALGSAAQTVLPSLGRGLLLAGVAVAMPLIGFGLGWLAIAGTATVRAMRRGLPFGMGWWSLTFPVGTMIGGTLALSRTTGVPLFAALAGILLGLLALTWSVVAVGTARAALRAIVGGVAVDGPLKSAPGFLGVQ